MIDSLIIIFKYLTMPFPDIICHDFNLFFAQNLIYNIGYSILVYIDHVWSLSATSLTHSMLLLCMPTYVHDKLNYRIVGNFGEH